MAYTNGFFKFDPNGIGVSYIANPDTTSVYYIPGQTIDSEDHNRMTREASLITHAILDTLSSSYTGTTTLNYTSTYNEVKSAINSALSGYINNLISATETYQNINGCNISYDSTSGNVIIKSIQDPNCKLQFKKKSDNQPYVLNLAADCGVYDEQDAKYSHDDFFDSRSYTDVNNKPNLLSMGAFCEFFLDNTGSGYKYMQDSGEEWLGNDNYSATQKLIDNRIDSKIGSRISIRKAEDKGHWEGPTWKVDDVQNGCIEYTLDGGTNYTVVKVKGIDDAAFKKVDSSITDTTSTNLPTTKAIVDYLPKWLPFSSSTYYYLIENAEIYEVLCLFSDLSQSNKLRLSFLFGYGQAYGVELTFNKNTNRFYFNVMIDSKSATKMIIGVYDDSGYTEYEQNFSSPLGDIIKVYTISHESVKQYLKKLI